MPKTMYVCMLIYYQILDSIYLDILHVVVYMFAKEVVALDRQGCAAFGDSDA